MNQFNGYSKGINLGGWLSQYQAYDHDHFNTFITETDLRQIAGWGFDHVRLPFDYPVLEDDERPFQYKASGFEYIDRCLEWCAAYGLNLVFDLHRAPGFSFNALHESKLFTTPELQERFIRLWEAIVERYTGWDRTGLVFELLNEVVLASSDPWNDLAHRTVERLRRIDNHHWIMVGGNFYNSVNTLNEIKLYDDPLVVYTFHYYDPLPFTHQKASWVEGLYRFDRALDYPGPLEGLVDFLGANPQYENRLGFYRHLTYLDRDLLRAYLQPAYDFMQRTGRPLYCGEFGAIELAPMQSRVRWTRDLVELLREAGIGYALWSYKAMDFGLVDQESRLVAADLVQAVVD